MLIKENHHQKCFPRQRLGRKGAREVPPGDCEGTQPTAESPQDSARFHSCSHRFQPRAHHARGVSILEITHEV